MIFISVSGLNVGHKISSYDKTNDNLFLFSLTKLQHLSVLDNKLEEVPVEVCHLIKLSEINLTSNKLSRLPQELYHCKELTKLYVARNKLINLPEVGIHFQLFRK